jgi:zinc/manganese transport system substrate-binding protein
VPASRGRAAASFATVAFATVAFAGVALGVAACGVASTAGRPGQIAAVGAEDQYADVISQVGGPFVHVAAVMTDPNTDPHTFEASPSVAAGVSSAKLIIQNGLGYDDFMDKIESASPSSSRKVIDVQHLLGVPDSTQDPHLWYRPDAMPAVARAVAAALSRMQPAHAAYFNAGLDRFIRALAPWYRALRRFRAQYPGAPVASTEPVGGYMLQAAGADQKTPFALQADVMNGVDPAPQNVTFQTDLITSRRVKALVYNQQVTDSLTETMLRAARGHGVPIVGMYETMPSDGYDYQSWMLAEVNALRRAVADGVSTERL